MSNEFGRNPVPYLSVKDLRDKRLSLATTLTAVTMLIVAATAGATSSAKVLSAKNANVFMRYGVAPSISDGYQNVTMVTDKHGYLNVTRRFGGLVVRHGFVHVHTIKHEVPVRAAKLYSYVDGNGKVRQYHWWWRLNHATGLDLKVVIEPIPLHLRINGFRATLVYVMVYAQVPGHPPMSHMR